MKKLFKITLVILVLSLFFQDNIAGESSQDQKIRVSKMASKEAKKYKKEGWKTNIGAPPLEIQFDQAWQKIAETDEDGFPKYLSVTVSAKDKDCDKAKFMAMELAQIRVANTLASQVEAVTRMNIDNEETCLNKSQSETEFVETSRINSAHHISKLNVILECWRQLADGDYEVRMMVAIPADNTKN